MDEPTPDAPMVNMAYMVLDDSPSLKMPLWRPVPPDEVPASVSTPEVVANLMGGGTGAKAIEDGRWYRGVVIEPEEKAHGVVH